LADVVHLSLLFGLLILLVKLVKPVISRPINLNWVTHLWSVTTFKTGLFSIVLPRVLRYIILILHVVLDDGALSEGLFLLPLLSLLLLFLLLGALVLSLLHIVQLHALLPNWLLLIAQWLFEALSFHQDACKD